MKRDSILLVLLVAVLALAGTAVAWREGPGPVRADAEPAAFSPQRAFEALADVLGDEAPHPVGSEANRRVRDRIELQLKQLGLAPEIQRGAACGFRGRCEPVENIVAVIRGSEARATAVMLASHYDSVIAGPGASDDGLGVAVALETARVLLDGPRPLRDVVLLFTDGEEVGMLGAQVFVREHALARRVAEVINVDARGTSGVGLLFETKRVGVESARRMAQVLPRPRTSSLFSAVYEHMPNDTDLTVFGGAGMRGYNLAVIGDVRYYHTAKDDLAHVQLASLQHLGDGALALVRDLAQRTDAAATDDERPAVWFDWLGLAVVVWPAWWSTLLGLAAAAITLRAGALAASGTSARSLVREATLSALAFVGLLIVPASLTAVFAFGLLGPLSRDGWHELSWPGAVAAAGMACLGLGIASHVARSDAFVARIVGTAACASVSATVVALLAPSASHLFVVPSLALAAAALFAAWYVGRGHAKASRDAVPIDAAHSELPADPPAIAVPSVPLLALVAPLAAMFAAATMWLPIASTLVDALGLAGQPGVTFAVVCAVYPALPVIAELRPPMRWSIAALGAALFVAGTVGALVLPRG